MRPLILLLAAVAAQAQGTTPKISAAEYPEHVQSGLNEIGAEYMVHSFSEGKQTFPGGEVPGSRGGPFSA